MIGDCGGNCCDESVGPCSKLIGEDCSGCIEGMGSPGKLKKTGGCCMGTGPEGVEEREGGSCCEEVTGGGCCCEIFGGVHVGAWVGEKASSSSTACNVFLISITVALKACSFLMISS